MAIKGKSKSQIETKKTDEKNLFPNGRLVRLTLDIYRMWSLCGREQR